MAWGTETTLTGLNTSLSETTNVDSDYVASNHYSQAVTLNPGESAQVQINAAFGATGNDLYFRVTTTPGTNQDTVAFVSGSVPFVASTTQYRTITVSNVASFRIEVRKGGTTAGSYTPNVIIKKNGISV